MTRLESLVTKSDVENLAKRCQVLQVLFFFFGYSIEVWLGAEKTNTNHIYQQKWYFKSHWMSKHRDVFRHTSKDNKL